MGIVFGDAYYPKLTFDPRSDIIKPMIVALTTGVNPLDNMIIKGEVKLIVPYKFPLVMGNEFCGIIEKTGTNVKGFAVGDRVYARMPLAKIGAFAEYTAIDYRATHLLTACSRLMM